MEKLTALDPEVTSSDAVVIGDTPHDITCADAIGVRALIVKGGSTYKAEDLKNTRLGKSLRLCPKHRNAAAANKGMSGMSKKNGKSRPCWPFRAL